MLSQYSRVAFLLDGIFIEIYHLLSFMKKKCNYTIYTNKWTRGKIWKLFNSNPTNVIWRKNCII